MPLHPPRHPAAHPLPGYSKLKGFGGQGGSLRWVPLGSLQIQSSWASHCIGIHCREARSSTAQVRMSSSS